jgi:hypothetical protein
MTSFFGGIVALFLVSLMISRCGFEKQCRERGDNARDILSFSRVHRWRTFFEPRMFHLRPL